MSELLWLTFLMYGNISGVSTVNPRPPYLIRFNICLHTGLQRRRYWYNRPHESGSIRRSNSLFYPPKSGLISTVRTLYVDAAGTNVFRSNPDHNISISFSFRLWGEQKKKGAFDLESKWIERDRALCKGWTAAQWIKTYVPVTVRAWPQE